MLFDARYLSKDVSYKIVNNMGHFEFSEGRGVLGARNCTGSVMVTHLVDSIRLRDLHEDD